MVALVLGLAACGGGGAVPPPAGGVGGYVFAGVGSDGNFSGRPLPGVVVRYESEGETLVLTTAADGSFWTGRMPASPFTLHVVPPPTVAAARSVCGLRVAETGTTLRFYLPTRTPAGGPHRPTGNRPLPAVVGTLVTPSGVPQAGSVPPRRTPGEPGTRGFVWWGAYRFQSVDCPRCYSTVAGQDGTFEIQGYLGGQALGRTFPFFAGNYDGVSPDRAVAHYTAYAFRPAVDVVSSGPAALGRVELVPVAGELAVHYDSATAAVAGRHGSGGVVYTYLMMAVGLADRLELAEAANGPSVLGTTVLTQSVPVPQVPEAPSRYFVAASFVVDTRARGLPEVAATLVSRTPGQPLRIGHLVPPAIQRVDATRRPTFTWTPSPGATLHAVTVLDARFSEVWTGVLGAHGTAAAVPFDLPPGLYRVFVFASDAQRPADLVASGDLPPLASAVVRLGPLTVGGRDVLALSDALGSLRRSLNTQDRGQLLSVRARSAPAGVKEAVSQGQEFTVP